jgi:hypothetical protein
MGQWYHIANHTKKQSLHPHTFGDGLKQAEVMDNGMMLAALALLISDGQGEWGSDLEGSWSGDRIALVGDGSPTREATDHYEDISLALVGELAQDSHFRKQLIKATKTFRTPLEPLGDDDESTLLWNARAQALNRLLGTRAPRYRPRRHRK